MGSGISTGGARDCHSCALMCVCVLMLNVRMSPRACCVSTALPCVHTWGIMGEFTNTCASCVLCACVPALVPMQYSPQVAGVQSLVERAWVRVTEEMIAGRPHGRWALGVELGAQGAGRFHAVLVR